MTSYIDKHPSILLNQDINEICSPLKKINIDYFAHVLVTPQNEFSAIVTNANFAEHYLKKEYYNVDVHMEETQFTPYIIEDMLEFKGLTAELQSEAAQFGVKHVFTIIEQNLEGQHYYHFGNSGDSFAINQTYLSNLDLLKKFICYFKEKINNSKELKTAHQYKFQIEPNTNNYQSFSDILEMNQNNRQEYLRLINFNLNNNIILLNKKNSEPVKLTIQQSKCVNLLAAGKTNKQIATILGLSIRTVQHYLDRVRDLLNCHSSKELISLYHAKS